MNELIEDDKSIDDQESRSGLDKCVITYKLKNIIIEKYSNTSTDINVIEKDKNFQKEMKELHNKMGVKRAQFSADFKVGEYITNNDTNETWTMSKSSIYKKLLSGAPDSKPTKKEKKLTYKQLEEMNMFMLITHDVLQKQCNVMQPVYDKYLKFKGERH
jgi:hypothetical protein